MYVQINSDPMSQVHQSTNRMPAVWLGYREYAAMPQNAETFANPFN
jgi:hypothetical protein